jgi:hypothetical protein
MAYLSRVAFLLLGAMASSALAQTGLAGHWEGSPAESVSVKLLLDVDRDPSGAWIGSLAQSVNQTARAMPLYNLKVSEKGLSFSMSRSPAATPYQCALDDPGVLICVIGSPVSVAVVELKRTGDAKVDIPKPSPAVSAELAGDWEGTMEYPGRSMPVVLHFQNRPDKTVNATIDVSGQSMDLSDVAQNGETVEFQLRAAGLKFKFSLKGDTLKGEVPQGNTPIPINLKKAAAK